jgi:hypothetical protein
MANFAHISNGIVDNVIVVEQDVINSGAFGSASEWIQTSYNTRGGVYYEPNSNTPALDQTKALRKNYAGLGYSYDSVRDAFISPKPYTSWTLNELSCVWEPPVPRPVDGSAYRWDEATANWVQLP